jgi:DNA-binding IclR family transcriptional regulator
VPYSNGVSAAALDSQGRPVAVVNVWGIEQRVPVKRFPALGEATRATACTVAALLESDR